jgi:Tol biopolymer transport system component
MKKLLWSSFLILPLLLYALQYKVTNYPSGSVPVGTPCWSPDGTKIAYTARIDGKYDIYTIPSSGGGVPTRITFSPNNNAAPAWSPDGTKIAFENFTSSGSYHVRYITLSSGQETLVTDGALPCWSPNGAFLAFCRVNGNQWYIWKKELSTGIETQLTFGSYYDTGPDWSHNGFLIIFNRNDVNPTIWTIPSEGGTPTQVPLEYGYGPKWSPDDMKIAVDAGNDFGGYSIYVYNCLTHELFQATPDSIEWCVSPAWSPDGGKIAYNNAHDDNIWVVTYGVGVESTSLGRLKSLYK